MSAAISDDVTAKPEDRLALAVVVARKVGLIRYLPVLAGTGAMVASIVLVAFICVLIFHMNDGLALLLGLLTGYVAYVFVCRRLARLVLRRNFSPTGSFTEAC